MKEKIYAAVLAIVLVSGIGLAVSPSLASGSGGGSGSTSEKEIIPPYYYNYDYPVLLVLKGVAVDGSDIEPAVFVGIGDENEFGESYLIVDGEAYELDLEDVYYDEETGTAIAEFDAGEEDLTLVLKRYRINYRDVVVASGQFGDYILNMRMVGYEEPVYKIMAEKAEILETVVTEGAVEEMAEIVIKG